MRSARQGRRLLFTLMASAIVSSAAWAHADLKSASIDAFGILTPSDTLILNFTMEVELAFSQFHLIYVAVPSDRQPDQPSNPTPAERARLNALAAQALTRATSDDQHALVIAPSRGRSERVALKPQHPLAAGLYALQYQVLAVDGHTTRGTFLFWVEATP